VGYGCIDVFRTRRLPASSARLAGPRSRKSQWIDLSSGSRIELVQNDPEYPDLKLFDDARCPSGFGCDGEAALCSPGTYSLKGMCVGCPANRSSDAGASECVCLTADCTACPVNTIAVGTQCRPSPKGYGLIDNNELWLCPCDTYSSPLGRCLPCSPNAWSEPGALSADECVCVDGYTRINGGECVPCKAGTVHSDHQCVLCPAGENCLGKTHHEPCPIDMFSHRGAGMCTPCRLNSGCLKHCINKLNCTCDAGYIDVLGECRRCPPRR
jgi:hypothetical protein